MSNWKVGSGGRLYHPTTGAYVGQLDDNGNEQMVLSYFPSDQGVKVSAGDIFWTPKDAPRPRQAANRCGINNRVHTTNRQINSASTHTAMAPVSRLKIRFQNWYVAVSVNGNGDGTETVLGDATITAGIEYPTGTFTRVTFSGGSSGAAGSGATLESDWVLVSIPRGAKFKIWSCYRGTTGIPYRTAAADTGLDIAQFSVSGLSDTSMGGTITATQAGSYYSPLAIIAETTVPAIAVIGDSRAQGINDAGSSAIGFVGEFGRILDPLVPNINLGQQSDMAQFFAGSSSRRIAMLDVVDGVIYQLGINDHKATTPRTAAQMVGDLKVIAASIAVLGKPLLAATLAPYTTSTDSWATTGNQTVRAYEAQRIAYNDLVRQGGIENVAGYIEVADAVETARNSGIWKAPGYTTDGLHESATANAAIAAAAPVPVWFFR